MNECKGYIYISISIIVIRVDFVFNSEDKSKPLFLDVLASWWNFKGMEIHNVITMTIK